MQQSRVDARNRDGMGSLVRMASESTVQSAAKTQCFTVWYKGGWTRHVCWFVLDKLVAWSALKSVKMEEEQFCVFESKLVV